MTTHQIAHEDLQALFDMCVNSMNFGSGFLETGDVVLLRKVAVLIGVEPWVATPREFRRNYPHTYLSNSEYHRTRTGNPYFQVLNGKACRHCDQPPQHFSHTQAPA